MGNIVVRDIGIVDLRGHEKKTLDGKPVGFFGS